MPTSTLTLFHAFKEKVMEGVMNLQGDTLKVALTNTAPVASTGATLADITEISYTNCSARTLTVSSSAQSAGTYKLVLDDLVLTASGGDVGPFRYAVIYDDTPAGDPLIGYLDYGSALTIQSGESLTLDMSPTNGILQVS